MSCCTALTVSSCACWAVQAPLDRLVRPRLNGAFQSNGELPGQVSWCSACLTNSGAIENDLATSGSAATVLLDGGSTVPALPSTRSFWNSGEAVNLTKSRAASLFLPNLLTPKPSA